MPDQLTNVQITIVPGENGEAAVDCDIQYGPVGTRRPITYLFDQETDDQEHLIGNIRLKRIIGGYTEAAIWSSEFLDALNETGVKTNTGTYYVMGITVNQDGSTDIAFGLSKLGPASQTITIGSGDLVEETHDIDMVLRNVRSFLRIAGYADLTTPAPNGLFAGKTAAQAVATRTFRY